MTDHEISQGDPQSDGTPSGPAPDRSRRRFLGAGAAVSPAVLTLMSSPALGGTSTTCFTPSRSLSKNTSLSQKDKYGTCSGCLTVTKYKSDSTCWPSSTPNSTYFHTCFPYNPMTCKTASGRSQTCKQMLNDTTAADIHKYMLAAYLNCKNGYVPSNVLTADQCVQIWTEFQTSGGKYEPTAGVSWDASKIIAYLQDNQICPAG